MQYTHLALQLLLLVQVVQLIREVPSSRLGREVQQVLENRFPCLERQGLPSLRQDQEVRLDLVLRAALLQLKTDQDIAFSDTTDNPETVTGNAN